MEKETGTGLSAEIDEPPGRITQERIEIWQEEDALAVKNVEDLSKDIPLLKTRKEALKKVTKFFHLRIPRYYLSLIKNVENTKDPVYMQCIPSPSEMKFSEYDKMDPLGEVKTEATRFLIHRYPDRALLLVTGKCFMYCRHCTRKRLWRCQVAEPTLDDLEKSLEYVRENEQIREIVISGGDPLTLSTEKIESILSSVSEINTVEAVRIGTRAPVVFPERIDEELLAVFRKFPKLWINVQFNHPIEITPESTEACRNIQLAGVPVSNQSVLLKGINDNAEVMTELCHKLQSIRVRPYYLFQCDPVIGAAHFRTSIFKGVEIMEKMRGHTGGMCVPTFVVDGVDGKGKVPVSPNYLISASDKSVILRNYDNEIFEYHNPT
ncbi:MAG: KamA family radical SAM protein [Candidatus Omnitrophota bacterium]